MVYGLDEDLVQILLSVVGHEKIQTESSVPHVGHPLDGDFQIRIGRLARDLRMGDRQGQP